VRVELISNIWFSAGNSNIVVGVGGEAAADHRLAPDVLLDLLAAVELRARRGEVGQQPIDLEPTVEVAAEAGPQLGLRFGRE
jgi:hypothetical protein